MRLPVNPISAKKAVLSLGFYPGKTLYILESGDSGEVLDYGTTAFDFRDFSPYSAKSLEEALPYFSFEFKKVWAFVNVKEYALLPAEYYNRKNGPHALATVGKLGLEPYQVRWDNSFMTNTCLAYNIPQEFEKFLSRQHSSLSLREEKSVLNQALRPYSIHHTYYMCLNHCEEWCDVLIFHQGKLIFTNSYFFTTISALKETIEKVCNGLQINFQELFAVATGLWKKEQLSILENHIKYHRLDIPFTGKEQIEYFSTHSISK